MKWRRRLRLFPPQLRLELRLPSGLSETRSSDMQVVVPLPAPVGVAVWGAEAVVAVDAEAVVDAAAVRINRTKGGGNRCR